jgi:hypothetical protein
MQMEYFFKICLVQGRPFEVKEMFLEDILRTTGYTNKEMLKYKKEKQRGKLFIKEIAMENYFLEYSSLLSWRYKDT